MRILCKLFGHKPPEQRLRHSWNNGFDLLRTRGRPTYRLSNRAYFFIEGVCPRCRQEYVIGMLEGKEVTQHIHRDHFKHPGTAANIYKPCTRQVVPGDE